MDNQYKHFPLSILSIGRPTFVANTLFLIGIMVLYPLAGGLLYSLVSGGSQEALSLLHIESSMLPSIRLIQAVGQIFVLALPVLLLAGWHTGKKNPFSQESLAFLGICRSADFAAVAFAVSGIFLLQPLLYTVTAMQDSYVWPALGEAGTEVVRQRDLMEIFIKELAQVRSVQEFIAVAFVLAVIPAVCEELLFRGYIQQNYSSSMSSGAAVLLTGFIFALFHMSAANLLPLALLGWYIGYIYMKTANLIIPFVVHLVNNLAALFLLLFTENKGTLSAFVSENILRSPWWWLLVAGSLLLFVMVLRRLSSLSSFRIMPLDEVDQSYN
jgi:membrane protease YdiL (CAAX protease family)